MSVVGFDFGNEFCKIAVARRRGIDVLQNEVGHRTTPSMVAFSGSQRFIGNDASSQYMSNASNTISQIKRFLGRSMNDPELSYEQVPYKSVSTTKGTVGVEVNYDDKKEIFSAEQIAGAIFTKLKGVAERGLDGTRVTDCVIGCPSYWTDQQRRAMLDAANIAGLNVLRLMNETTAVALNYGILRPLPKDTSQKVIFFDMGHSQTSASLVSFVEGKLEVLATSSDRNLGARNFDNMLIQHFASYIKTKYNLDVLSETKATLKLTKECQRVKNMLSANVKVPFNVEYIMKDTDVSGVIERAEFDALACKEVCPRIVAVLKKLMDTSGVPLSSVHSIEIVGGGVRIPIVQKTIQDWFGRDLSKTCDGDESVARGAALMCAMISPSFKVREFEVQDIFPYPIDLKWGPVSESFKAEDQTPLFIPNNPIPSVKLISFNDRTEPFQVVAEYAENSQIPPATPQRVGHFIISGMPSKQADVKAPKIKVRVKLNTHGTLAVTQAQLIEEIKEIETKDEEMKDANAAAPTPTDTTKDADKMETDKPTDAATKSEETKPATDAKMEEEPKKVKVKRTDLKIESFFTGGLDATTLSQYFEKECAMANQDRTIAETGEARNALESYVLEMRGRVQDGDLTPYTNAKEKDPFLQSLDTIESWLYGDGSEAQKSEYKNRLADLKKTGDAIVGRYHEHQQRPEFIAALKSSIGHYQQLASSSDEKYAHIDKSERDKILQETSSLDAWLTDHLIKQDKHPLNETPILTCDALKQKKLQLENMANPIMNKPKPAPPKVEEPKKEEPKKEEPKKEEPAAAGGATPTSGDGMDTKP